MLPRQPAKVKGLDSSNPTLSADRHIERLCQQDERCRRLVKVEGVGPLVATAVVAAVGNARQFKNGRELSAWLGLVPREYSSGNRTVMLGILRRRTPTRPFHERA